MAKGTPTASSIVPFLWIMASLVCIVALRIPVYVILICIILLLFLLWGEHAHLVAKAHVVAMEERIAQLETQLSAIKNIPEYNNKIPIRVEEWPDEADADSSDCLEIDPTGLTSHQLRAASRNPLPRHVASVPSSWIAPSKRMYRSRTYSNLKWASEPLPPMGHRETMTTATHNMRRSKSETDLGNMSTKKSRQATKSSHLQELITICRKEIFTYLNRQSIAIINSRLSLASVFQKFDWVGSVGDRFSWYIDGAGVERRARDA
ncbi:hypothetical protein CC86DRAFT_380254 [Ophiobolus disseminans]|uniref:Uncharacterized protein n=1 Tax=Ophiobolus disseminans TaxID=1469910 RepID=A0A6A7AA79_9PLEO|nr:hypothetical protein CC86DRAFT_380254 [Ophiobolus disseminans]